VLHVRGALSEAIGYTKHTGKFPRFWSYGDGLERLCGRLYTVKRVCYGKQGMYKTGTLVRYYGAAPANDKHLGLRNNICMVVDGEMPGPFAMLYDLKLGKKFQANIDMIVPLDMGDHSTTGNGNN